MEGVVIGAFAAGEDPLREKANKAFNSDSLQRGILLRKILRPAANHSAGKPAPFCRLTWR